MKNLEIEFVLERERRYLRENPTQAIALVLSYLEDFLHLSKEFKVLEQKYQSAITKWHCAIADNQKLTSQLIEMSNPTRADKYVKRKRNVSSSGVKLPSFLACHRH